MVNKPLIRPAISGGGYVARGGRLTSHDFRGELLVFREGSDMFFSCNPGS